MKSRATGGSTCKPMSCWLTNFERPDILHASDTAYPAPIYATYELTNFKSLHEMDYIKKCENDT